MACGLLGKSRATLYRQRNPEPPAGAERREEKPRAPHPAALGEDERRQVVDVLDSDRFADKSPAQAWAILLDEGCYLCSIRTMYRVLAAAGQDGGDRRPQAAHPPRVRPELVADGPDQVWTWDITKLKGPSRGIYLACTSSLTSIPGKSFTGKCPGTRTVTSRKSSSPRHRR